MMMNGAWREWAIGIGINFSNCFSLASDQQFLFISLKPGRANIVIYYAFLPTENQWVNLGKPPLFPPSLFYHCRFLSILRESSKWQWYNISNSKHQSTTSCIIFSWTLLLLVLILIVNMKPYLFSLLSSVRWTSKNLVQYLSERKVQISVWSDGRWMLKFSFSMWPVLFGVNSTKRWTGKWGNRHVGTKHQQ